MSFLLALKTILKLISGLKRIRISELLFNEAFTLHLPLLLPRACEMQFSDERPGIHAIPEFYQHLLASHVILLLSRFAAMSGRQRCDSYIRAAGDGCGLLALFGEPWERGMRGCSRTGPKLGFKGQGSRTSRIREPDAADAEEAAAHRTRT